MDIQGGTGQRKKRIMVIKGGKIKPGFYRRITWLSKQI
jgi:hypothetical protein